MRRSDLVWLVTVLVLGVGILAPVEAQDAPKPAPVVAPDPAYQALDKRLQAAETALKQVQAQAARDAQSVEKIQASYAATFKAAKEQAGPGCRAAGGRLRADVDSAGKVSVSCQW